MNLIALFFYIIFACVQKISPITWKECANTVGNHPCNFTLTDQHKKDWNLYDHYGTVIILDFTAEWCYWCQVAAVDVADLEKRYDNVLFVTVILEDRQGNITMLSTVNRWAEGFGITSPVLFGVTELDWEVSGLPTFYIINKEMVVTGTMQGMNIDVLERLVKEALK